MKTLVQIIGFFVVFASTAMAQDPWILESSEITGSQKVIFSIIVTDSLTVWAGVMDYNTNPPYCEFTKTLNGGTTWVAGIINQSNNHKFMSLAALNKDTAWVAAIKSTGVTGDIFRTYDGGSTWTRPDTSIYKGATSFPDDIYFFDKSTGFCFGDPDSGYFEIYTTVNGGNSWTRVPSENIPPPLSSEGCYQDVFFAVNDTAWVGSSLGRIFRSVDRGLTWTVSVSFTDVPVRALAFRDCKNGLVFGGGINNYKRTTDGGSTWDSFSLISGSYSFSFGKSLIYVKGNASEPGMYLCGGRNSTYHFANYSKDDGETWNTIDQMYHSCFGFYDVTKGWSCAFPSATITADIYKFEGLPSGISNHKNPLVISIYPNSSTGLFSIQSEVNFTHIEILNMLGKLVYTRDFNSHTDKIQIDLTGQPSGIYFFQVRDRLKALGTGKIVIRSN